MTVSIFHTRRSVAATAFAAVVCVSIAAAKEPALGDLPKITSGSSSAVRSASDSVAPKNSQEIRPIEETGVRQWARRIDQALSEKFSAKKGGPLPTRQDDALFLRRLNLDLVGSIPYPSDVEAFLYNKSPNKRAEYVDRLLADARYGEHWGRYWRDVIFYRRSDPRALLAAPATAAFVAEALNNDRPWDEVAREFIRSEGDIREIGSTAIFAAQQGQAAETAAEISRIFMGIQIQCAQCHDHPTDQWKREQFHEFAAFFPRVTFRPQRSGDKRSFVVLGSDRPRIARKKDNPGRGELEQRIPNLDDPSQPGAVVKPVFFVTGQSLPLGSTDGVRRGELSKWLTSEQNPWFARSLVNRVWSEMVGWGFYPNVDDLGPERNCASTEALDVLVEGFKSHGYSVKSLVKAIALTEAYQQPNKWGHIPDESPYAGRDSSQLTADQLFDSVAAVMDLPLPMAKSGRRGPMMMIAAAGGPRLKYQQVFGYDPSLPAEEVAMSVPQALSLMNSPELQRRLSSQARFSLAGRMAAISDDEACIRALYLRVLSREPSRAESTIAAAHLKNAKERAAAVEDLAWVLLNSTEFMHKPR